MLLGNRHSFGFLDRLAVFCDVVLGEGSFSNDFFVLVGVVGDGDAFGLFFFVLGVAVCVFGVGRGHIFSTHGWTSARAEDSPIIL